MPHLNADERRAYQLRWSKDRRNAWIASRGGSCESCGSMDELQVDHIDPATKVYNPRSVWNRRAEIREAELAKCQVLCATCHRAKTDAENAATHGSHSMYVKGCRCDDCRQAHAAQARRTRAKRQLVA